MRTCGPAPGLRRLIAAVFIWFGAVLAGFADEIAVANAAALAAALDTARDGDTIQLADGQYGAVEIRARRFRAPVTLRAANAGAAAFESLSITDSGFLRFEGLHVQHPGNGQAGSKIVALKDSEHIEIIGCEINGRVDAVFDGHFGIHVLRGTALRFEGNFVHDVKHGIAVFGGRGVAVIGNRLEDIGEDSFKFAAVTGVLVANNTGPARMFPAKGAHDDFMQFQGGPSHRVTIRGNVFLPQNSLHAQGIFFGGEGGHTELLIEENIIATAVRRGISVNSGSGIVIRQNTVIGLLGPGGRLAHILAPEDARVEQNIWAGKTGERRGSNLVAQAANADAPYYYAQLFRNALRLPAPQLEDLVPLPDGSAAAIGAVRRLQELLGPAP